LCLIAVAWSDPVWILNVLKVVIGLGMVIFVHELGHFLVAKLCGVKCEKFYLGFDIGGLKLWKYRWGETEYGIGILPLGGYVKMLGQEDNPSRLREEMERAKAKTNGSPAAADADSTPNSQPPDSQSPTPNSQPSSPDSEQAVFDPRSYLAKSVPKRMAIISAGVVMNVLFALATGVWAYWIGIDEVECGVGAVVPGAPAWQAGFEVGDQITQIRGNPVDRYKDLRAAISVGDISGGVPMLVRRPGVAEPLTITVQPKKTKSGPVPTIGILPPMSPVLDRTLPVLPGTPAAAWEHGFQPGDRIVAIDGKPIEDYAPIHHLLALNPDKALWFTVERGGAAKAGDSRTASPGPVERLRIEVAPAPLRQLGMSMTMGKVTAIQRQSPAEAAGIAPGDTITKIDGQPIGDPLTLPDRLRIRAWKEPLGAAVTLSVIRPNPLSISGTGALDIQVRLRRPDSYEPSLFPGDPVAVPALGVAYEVLNEVAGVEAGGPAAKAGLKPGDVVVKAKLTPPADERVRQLPYGEQYVDLGVNRPITADLKKAPNGWPALAEAIQKLLPGGTVELTLADDRVVELQPVDAPDWFRPERGFEFEAKTFFSGGQSFALAVRLGTRETIDSLTIVYRFLAKLGTRQVDATAFGGPLSIFDMAYRFAAQGFADLLIFLMIIGANLAVINFLPIPVLDGGHMVFLAYEGITGKPPSEKVYVTLTYLGLLFILALMLWVIGLDMMRYVPSWLSRIF